MKTAQALMLDFSETLTKGFFLFFLFHVFQMQFKL